MILEIERDWEVVAPYRQIETKMMINIHYKKIAIIDS